jgi:hypothetical protein
LIGYISKGISLCGKMPVDFQDATKAFDIAFMFTNGNSRTTHLLLLIRVNQLLLTYPLLSLWFLGYCTIQWKST